jgi:dihydrofolate reductase
MRKIIVLSFISLDGVMQAPGGVDEDPSGGFNYGGWTFPYMDEFGGAVIRKQLGGEFDLLLGRKTYELFAGYWPKAGKGNPIGVKLNAARKYVVSNSLKEASWEKTTIISGEILEKIRELKAQAGPDLQVHGSSSLIQTLLKGDLVDELWLKIFPITLGSGKKLFRDGTIPATFRLLECKASPKGVIIANYARVGQGIKTGTIT